MYKKVGKTVGLYLLFSVFAITDGFELPGSFFEQQNYYGIRRQYCSNGHSKPEKQLK